MGGRLVLVECTTPPPGGLWGGRRGTPAHPTDPQGTAASRAGEAEAAGTGTGNTEAAAVAAAADVAAAVAGVEVTLLAVGEGGVLVLTLLAVALAVDLLVAAVLSGLVVAGAGAGVWGGPSPPRCSPHVSARLGR